ncbi:MULTISPECIES: CRISPR-associated endonuclease Cas2 [unclassified Thermosipho (in: thermotogales)]|uniref:CRISPR-associated endonuclease Cas2 n=1 Tax=unclassified Thermosipho (in: thermotogales) TaxID=2676525 RepID=UPI0009493885|nr:MULTISPECIES: CRISPR-associated endonuclease Cas2 [unclassified Thermosipho (in: thermotogales)]ANQ53043.1 CRISPR-associated protein Cas2 [Thermosipho sp. 1070]
MKKIIGVLGIGGEFIRYILLTYDVNEKRVSRVHKIVKEYLVWQQNSTFEGKITQSNLKQLIGRLKRVIDERKDSVVIYYFNSSAVFNKEVDGKVKWIVSNNLL